MNLSVNKSLKEKYEIEQVPEDFYQIGAKGKFANIIALTKGLRFEKVLEVGAGSGSILAQLDEYNYAPKLYALEISDNRLEVIKQRNLKTMVDALLFDGYKIPYPDNFFDLVILSHVIEHVEYPRALLREIKRVSKFQFIEIPREYHHNIDKQIDYYLSYGHIDVYTPSLMRFLLRSEGFEIIREKKGFYSKEVLQFNKNTLFQQFRLVCFIFIRDIAYYLLPQWRTDTMINYFSVLTK